ncbi:MAG: hypothetical protein LH615_04105 [Ferruginibacter sp.]|nr:hypothetical protein [Ferruginibacter sp.]
MILFDGISDLWLYNYDMYCKTQDYNWFVVGYTGKETKIDESLIYPHAIKIIDEYYLRLDNKSFQLNIQKMAKINAMHSKYVCINLILDILEIGFDLGEMKQRYDVVQELNNYGFSFPKLASHSEDMENVAIIRIQVKVLKNEILKVKESLKSESIGTVKETSKILKEIKIALKMADNINVKNTTLLDFIELCEILKDSTHE